MVIIMLRKLRVVSSIVAIIMVIWSFWLPPPQVIKATHKVIVSVTINPQISASFSDEGIFIQSNTGWKLQTKTTCGKIKTIHGDRTNGKFIPLSNNEQVLYLVKYN